MLIMFVATLTMIMIAVPIVVAIFMIMITTISVVVVVLGFQMGRSTGTHDKTAELRDAHFSVVRSGQERKSGGHGTRTRNPQAGA